MRVTRSDSCDVAGDEYEETGVGREAWIRVD